MSLNRPGDDEGPVPDGIDDRADELGLLLGMGGGRLPGRTVEHEAVVAVGDQVDGERRGGSEVDRSVVRHGRDHGREQAPERLWRRIRHGLKLPPGSTGEECRAYDSRRFQTMTSDWLAREGEKESPTVYATGINAVWAQLKGIPSMSAMAASSDWCAVVNTDPNPLAVQGELKVPDRGEG